MSIEASGTMDSGIERHTFALPVRRKTERRPSGRPRRFLCACLAGTALTVPMEAQAQKAKDKEKTTELQQIVVTATGFERHVKDAPASITVVTGEELEKGSFRDLTDALRDAQGVAVTGVATSATSSSAACRGPTR